MTRTYRSESASQTEAIAAQLSRLVTHGIVALYGPLGAGKTAFARGFFSTRTASRVSSPTYTVMNCYSDTLYHLDLYRITSEEDLESVGFYDIPEDAIVLCEWAENLPKNIHVSMSVCIQASEGENLRVLTVTDDANTCS